MISTSTGPIFAKFSLLVELWLQMNGVKLVFPPARDVTMATNFVGPVQAQSTELASRAIC